MARPQQEKCHPFFAPVNTAIIVLNWNGKEDTLSCLESLKTVEADLIVVDNGSTDDSVSTISKRYPNIQLIATGHNLGYAGGNNVGIEFALKQLYRYVLLLNNDTRVDPNIVEAFKAGFAAYKSAGVLGGKILLMDEPDRLDHFGGHWNPKRKDFDYFGHRTLDEGQFTTSVELDYVCGAAMMVRREVFEAVGLLDPRFFLFWEEADFCQRVRNAGFEVRSCPAAKLWHKVSASFVGGKPHGAYFLYRNRLLWIERNVRGVRGVGLRTKLIAQTFTSFGAQTAVRFLQALLQKALGKDLRRNRERLIRSRAALSGTWDYLVRNFGEGRSKNFINCL